MNIDFKIEYETKDGNVCFKHATIRAIKGEDIKTVWDDYDSYMSHVSCVDCEKEEEEKEDE